MKVLSWLTILLFAALLTGCQSGETPPTDDYPDLDEVEANSPGGAHLKPFNPELPTIDRLQDWD